MARVWGSTVVVLASVQIAYFLVSLLIGLKFGSAMDYISALVYLLIAVGLYLCVKSQNKTLTRMDNLVIFMLLTVAAAYLYVGRGS